MNHSSETSSLYFLIKVKVTIVLHFRQILCFDKTAFLFLTNKKRFFADMQFEEKTMQYLNIIGSINLPGR